MQHPKIYGSMAPGAQEENQGFPDCLLRAGAPVCAPLALNSRSLRSTASPFLAHRSLHAESQPMSPRESRGSRSGMAYAERSTMTRQVSQDERSRNGANHGVRFCLQRRSTEEFWNGETWEAGLTCAELFSGIDAALACAKSLHHRAVDFVVIFSGSERRITIPLGS